MAPLADPVAVGDRDAVPNCDAGEGDDIDGKEDAGALREPAPTAPALLFI